MDTLPPDVLANMNYNDRRFIRTGPDRNDAESLDSRKLASRIFLFHLLTI